LQLWAGTEIWATPVARIGQGNGAGPQIWVVVSTPILNLLRQEGYSTTFKASISGNKIHFVGYMFVDDKDLIQTGPTITTSETDTLPLMQAALDLWNQGLHATGGALVPEKSFWYSIDFKWRSRCWSYTLMQTQTEHLLMDDHNQNQRPLSMLSLAEAQRTLGMYLAPDRNNQLQEKILINKTRKWVENTRTAHLDCTAAWLNITTSLIQQIYYVLPATTFTPPQSERIMRPCLSNGLAAAGYMRSFPQAILCAPYKYYGLNLMDMYTEQGIQHILAALQFGHSLDDLTSRLICRST